MSRAPVHATVHDLQRQHASGALVTNPVTTKTRTPLATSAYFGSDGVSTQLVNANIQPSM
eukprot:6468611-Pyramimonas_sp.AAC.1